MARVCDKRHKKEETSISDEGSGASPLPATLVYRSPAELLRRTRR
jgi:hypothetical protein